MAIAFRYAAGTDVGLVRSRNEDSGYAGPHLLGVADGMGGHAGGNVASSLVMARLAPIDGDSHGSDDALDTLGELIRQANQELAEAVAADSTLTGMGTTLSIIMRAGSTRLALAHIGDSRGYLLRDGAFVQITRDHSYVQTLVDTGRITPDEAEHHPQRSLVTRVLTGAPDDEPDLSIREAKIGDRYLLCSDGLSDYVAGATIEEVVRSGATPEETVTKLISLALKSGAPDNVTCVIGDVVDPSTVPPTVPQIVGAVAERRAAEARQTDSPAARAAALRQQATGQTPDEGVQLAEEDTSPRRQWLRFASLGALLAIVLIGSLIAGYQWSQRQLFIAAADGKVAVYQGVHQQLGPAQLFSVRQATDIPVTDLPDFYRDAVVGGISTPDQAGADAKIAELRAQAAACLTKRRSGQACGSGEPGSLLSPSASPSGASSPSVAPGSGPTIGPAAGGSPATSAPGGLLTSSAPATGGTP